MLCSKFKPVNRDQNAWKSCLQSVDSQQDVQLTLASQRLFLGNSDSMLDPPSPMMESVDSYQDGEMDIEPDIQPCSMADNSIMTTGFRLKHRGSPVPTEADAAYQWTEEQRNLVKTAVEPRTMDDLERRVLFL